MEALDNTPEHLIQWRKASPEDLGLPIALSPEVECQLGKGAVVAVGVSGGKDSDACAIAVMRHLDAIGHTGPRLLIHADLGVVEWSDSLPSCERLAEKLGVELVVVARKAGDMMDRWEGRWASSVRRYNDLSCVKLILPWSTPSMRFCTSELKSAVIASALRKRFPNQSIISVTGIRREESSNRAKMPVWGNDSRISRKDAIGLVWNPIIEWKIDQVFKTIAQAGLRLHEAYTRYLASRVSCAFCIMSSISDMIAAAGCAGNASVYRRMVELELSSAFSFQGSRWLADVAPHLLSADQQARLAVAKAKATAREAIEKEIPKHLLFTKGWPTVMPTKQEAALIASVRSRVSALMELDAACLTEDTVTARYAELMTLKQARDAKRCRDDGPTAGLGALADDEELIALEFGNSAEFAVPVF